MPRIENESYASTTWMHNSGEGKLKLASLRDD